MRRFLLIALILLLPSLAQATVFFDVGLNSQAEITTFPGIDAPITFGDEMTIDTAIKHEGAASLRLNYPQSCQATPVGNGNCGGHIEWPVPFGTPKLYMRIWFRMAANTDGTGLFIPSLDTPTKMMYTRGFASNVWALFGGSGTPPKRWIVALQGIPAQQTTNVATSEVFSDNTWYCLETLEDGTTGTTQAWVNGTPVLNRTGDTYPAGGFSGIQLFRQTGQGDIWYDRFGAADTRFNDCGGVIDSTPPMQVTSFSVGSSTSSSLIITATNGTDAVDTNLTLRIERCQGAACSNFALVHTASVTGGSVTTYTDSGLAASTTFCYRANNQDQSNNLGAYSATACGTTSAGSGTVRRTLGSDDFNRANGAVGASYSTGYTGTTVPQIVSNAVQAAGTGQFAMATRTDVVPNDQWAQATMSAFTGSQNKVWELLLRVANSPTDNKYGCQGGIGTGGFGTGIFKYDGSATTFYQTVSHSFANGDVILCELQGTTLTMSVNGAVLLSGTTDGAYTAGKVGFLLETESGGALTDNILDSLSWGDYTVAAQPTITDAVTDSTGSTLTSGGSTPSFLRVQTDSTNIVYTWNDGVVMTAGRYTQPGGGWAFGLTFVCFFAQDANHLESSVAGDHQCDSLAGLTLPAPDTTPPVLVAGVPNGQTLANTATVTLAWTSDEPADLKFSTTDQAYASMGFFMTTVDGLHHSAAVAVSAGSNTFCARGQDRAPALNVDTVGVCMTFTVSAPAVGDTTAPTAPSNLLCRDAGSSTQASCTFTAGTDATGVTGNQAKIGVLSGGICVPSSIINPLWGTSSPQLLINLSGRVTYCLLMQAFDLAANISPASNTTTWTQPPLTDPNNPTDVTGLALLVNGLFPTQVTLIWKASTHPQGIAHYDTYRCTGTGCTTFNVKFTTPANAFTDTTVQPSTVYRYETFAVSPSGNVSANPSNILTVTTPALQPTQPANMICPCESY